MSWLVSSISQSFDRLSEIEWFAPFNDCFSFKNDQIQSFSPMIQENSPALAPQRREHLRQMLREGGVARVEDLRRKLDVSVATIRRDLEILE